jgi:riboflavin biosynthesis pyrimidine reductase
MPDSPASDEIEAFLAPIALAGALTVAVMVSSVDGRATIGGSVGELTGHADQQILHGVRERACAVVVGSSTAKTEGYDGLLEEDAQARRRGMGLSAEPELVLVSHSGPSVTQVWSSLRSKYPNALIASEGGPTMLGVEIESGLIDQLVLCVSPTLVGDDSQKRVIEHAAPLGVEVELLDSASAEGFVFLRYGIR